MEAIGSALLAVWLTLTGFLGVQPEPELGTLSVLKASQGGTGVGTATPSDVGKVLKVSDDSPFTYTLQDDNTGAGGSFPFTPTSYGNSTSTVLGNTLGFFANGSSTFNTLRTQHATGTNLDITGLLTFNGVTGSTWASFCTTITGSSALCDGNDATGGAGGTTVVSTSSSETSGLVPFWTSTNGTPATLSGGVAGFAWNDTLKRLTATFASTTALTATNIYGTLTGNADTATALAADPANCSAGNAPLGIVVSGAVEGCFDVWTEAENTSAAYISDGNTNWDNIYGFTTFTYPFSYIGGASATTSLQNFTGGIMSLSSSTLHILNNTHATSTWFATHRIAGDASDGILVEANNGTDVAILGAGNSSNSTFYGGVNIDGSTRLATSLTGILKATAGTVSVATAGTDYANFAYPFTPATSWFSTSTISLNTAGLISTASSSISFLDSVRATSTDFFATNATTSALRISNVLSFGGVSGDAWTDFCVTITGSAGLCDGNDGGGGGSSNWTDAGFVLTPLTVTDGVLLGASSPVVDAQLSILATSTATSTLIHASSSFGHIGRFLLFEDSNGSDLVSIKTNANPLLEGTSVFDLEINPIDPLFPTLGGLFRLKGLDRASTSLAITEQGYSGSIVVNSGKIDDVDIDGGNLVISGGNVDVNDNIFWNEGASTAGRLQLDGGDYASQADGTNDGAGSFMYGGTETTGGSVFFTGGSVGIPNSVAGDIRFEAGLGNNTNTTGGNVIFQPGFTSLTPFSHGDVKFLNSDASSVSVFIDGSTGAMGVGTSSPYHLLTISSSTGPQLSLTDTTLTQTPWTFRSINGNFYLATSSPTTFATSTIPAISITTSMLVTIGNALTVVGQTIVSALTATGIVDFGGALSFEIPNGTAPTVNLAGEIALDTTSGNVLFATSTQALVLGGATTTLYAMTIASTSPDFASGGVIPLPTHFLKQQAVGIICEVDGGTSQQIFLSDAASTNDTNTITCSTTETQYNFTTNNIWTAYEPIQLEFATKSGAPDYITIRIVGFRYTD